MKHIGIVGISAIGSALCYRYIAEKSASHGFPVTHPEISIHNFSFDKYFNAGPNDPNGWNDVHDIILSSIERLKLIGADFVIIPANTVHYNFSYLEERSCLPILSILDITVNECVNQKIKDVIVLGTSYTMQGHLYNEKLMQHGINPISLNSEQCNFLNDVICSELMKGAVNSSSVEKIKAIIVSSRCDGVILACTELPMIFPEASLPMPIINTTELLAQRALEHAI